MQMTGYMFQNAAYRLSLKNSLDKASRLLPGESGRAPSQLTPTPSGLPAVSGTIAVDLGVGSKIEVDAAAYVADLHNEVARLKSALARTAEKRAEDAGQGRALLAHLQTLPREQVQELSAGISPEVLECMQMLIEAVLARDTAVLGGATIVESSGIKMRELLVWQLISGYKLRELEQREELNKLLRK